MTHTAHRLVDVMDGNQRLASFEARYTFTVAGQTVDITAVHVRWHPKHDWQAATGQAFDMLTAEVPDAWFLAQIEAGEIAV